MLSDLQDREKSFGIKLGWNQLKSTIRKNRKERRKTKPLFCIKKPGHAKSPEIQNFLPHWNGRASEERGETALIPKIFKAPRKDTAGSSPGKMKATTGCASRAIHALQPHSAMARANCSSPRRSSLLHPDPAAVPGTRHCSFIRADLTRLNCSQRRDGGKTGGQSPRLSESSGLAPVSPLHPRTCSLPESPQALPQLLGDKALLSVLLFASAAEESSLRPAEKRGTE